MIENPECVHPSGMDEPVHPASLLDGKPGIFFIGFGIGKINGFMGNVKISTDDGCFFVCQLLYIFKQSVVEGKFIVYSFERMLGIGKIRIDQEKICKLKGKDTTFVIKLVRSYTDSNLQGFLFGINPDS